ncbi:hypothetical protein [Acinetobacter larvae]|uniref:Uncharacterized protein n=1 Tax=Acinetobacter larvae TaxID=1789224 RepID=A0A1B2LZ92_9GAMM|nr:hypothetical protein [Acinetobacter larvae]AOA58255.1 hypothetical protein BFG52_07735 [Acinetobacter larvae]
MNTQIHAPSVDHWQQQNIQSFHEPALRMLNDMLERKKENLRRRGYNENNAAVTKEELARSMERYFRIANFLAQRIVKSMVNAGVVESFGSYVKPKVVL